MTDHNEPKWTIRTGRTVYDNPWIRVREYQTIEQRLNNSWLTAKRGPDLPIVRFFNYFVH
jgi:hypothetical protein